MNNVILFFSETITPRLRYTMASIVGNMLRVEVVFTQDKTLFKASDLPKINYSESQIADNELVILPHRLLFEDAIRPYFIQSENDFFSHKINTENTLSVHSAADSTLRNTFAFDVFARIFYLISRYEEYNLDPSVLDAHGRFSASKSVAFRFGYLQQPLVNQYVMVLSEQLKTRFPQLEMPAPCYRFQPSFDIDMAWMYRHKGFVRNAVGFIKDAFKGQLTTVKKRAKILRGHAEDPYFTFDYIRNIHQQYGLKPVVFWLLADFAKYDINIVWTNPELRALIHALATDFTVGIHPSYRSNDGVSILEKEVKRLQQILNIPLYSTPKLVKNAADTEGSLFPSRQHFLKLRFPETYRRLIAVGIAEDWTMGYADETGFRASVATPFPWFDLEKNEETTLIIHPFQAMDVTLHHYLHLSPEAATERLRALIHATKAVGGTFTTLWHNDNLSEIGTWKGWKVVYERLLADATGA